MRPSSQLRRQPLHALFTLLVILAQLAAIISPALPVAAQSSAAHDAHAAASTPRTTSTLADQPLDLQYALSRQLGLDDAGYHLENEAGAVNAPNPAQGLRTTFDALGMQISAHGYGWGIELAGWGRGTSLDAVALGAQSKPAPNRVEFDHGPLSSWYVNGPLGVQQGWTLREQPKGTQGQPLTLALHQSGNLVGKLNADKRGLELIDATGVKRLSYDGLIAFDANNKKLPVWIELVDACAAAASCSQASQQPVAEPQQVRIRVDDAGAVYPVTIDPWVQTASVEPPEAVQWDDESIVAVNGDGSLIAVSKPVSDTIYLFTRSAEGEVSPQPIAKLKASDSGNKVGTVLAVSDDGSTIVAGPYFGSNVYLFARPANGWANATETTRLAAAAVPRESIAISSDGGTVVASSVYSTWTYRNAGAAYIFERPVAGWASKPSHQQSTILISSTPQQDAYLGNRVSVSGDGATIAASGSHQVTHIYRRPGGGWAGAATRTEYEKLSSPDWYCFPTDMIISRDASTIAAGCDESVWVFIAFTINGTTSFWRQAILTSQTPTADIVHRAVSIAMSGDGSKIAASEYRKNPVEAAILSYTRPDVGWNGSDSGAANPDVVALVPRSATWFYFNPKMAYSVNGDSLIAKPDDENYAPEQIRVFTPLLPTPEANPADVMAGGSRFTLTLTGSGFTPGSKVRWITTNPTATTTLEPTSVTSTTIQVSVGSELIAQPGMVRLQVASPLPNSSITAAFPYTVANPLPILTSIDPDSSPAGEPDLTLTARGNNFVPTSAILWNGAVLSTTFVNSTTVRADLGAAQIATVGGISVAVNSPSPGGGLSNVLTHTLLAAPAPTLNGISPFARAAGKPGFTLTVVGSDFMRRSHIFWGSQPLTTTYVNSTTLTADIPATFVENEGPISVTVATAAPGGGSSPAQQFSVLSAAPSLFDVFPYYGSPSGGTMVTLSGLNLETTSVVSFGLQAATMLTRTESELVVQSPAGPNGSADVTVTTRYGSFKMPGGFVYANSQPAQPWRDFGPVRVWADTFSTTLGTTIATGRIALGDAARNARYYRLSEQASWVTSDTLVLSGTLGFFGGDSLASGQFALSTASGAIVPQPGALVLFDKLGATNIAISPRLTLNALQDQVPVEAALVLSLPENPSLGIDVRYRLARDGSIQPNGASALSLALAGGALNTSVTVTTTGLSAPSGQLQLAGLAPISVPALTIGDAGLRIGTGGAFALPTIDLGNGVLALKALQATLQISGNSYELPLTGTLAIDRLPENVSRNLNTSGLRLANGTFRGGVGDISLTLGGAPLTLKGATLQSVGDRYRLVAAGGTWSLPAAWGSGTRPSVALSNLALATDAPFLRFAETSRFSIPGTFKLGGSAGGRNTIGFDQLQGELRVDGSHWAVDLVGRISFQLGARNGDGGSFNNALLTVANDSIEGTLGTLNLSLAGLDVTAINLHYRDAAFDGEQASVRLPLKWGGQLAQTGGIAITAADLQIGKQTLGPAATRRFSLPDISLAVLMFSANDAGLLVDKDNIYKLEINSTIVINRVRDAGGLAPRVPANLILQGGRISGLLPKLDFQLSGFDVNARNLQIIDDMVKTDVVTLTLPARLGKAQTKLYGLEIGGDKGFSVRGGKFKLPDFKMGGVGVENATAEFLKDGDDYVLGAEGRLEFTKINVEGAFKVAYNSSSKSVQVRRLMIAFEGRIPTPAVAIGNTGLFFTRISGEFNLDDGTMIITLGTRISTPTEIAGKSMLYMDASVTLQLRPSLEFRANADLYVIGMRAAYAELRIWGSGFSVRGAAELGILRVSMEVTFGLDTWNEFTFYGRINAEIRIPRGYLVNTSIFGINIVIPENDISIGDASLEGGKFSRGNDRFWGGRGSFTILNIFSISAMLRLGDGGGISLGSDIWEYQPVRPVVALALSQSDTPRDTFVFTAANSGLKLALVEALTTTQRLNPPALEIRSPRNLPFTATVAYTATDKSYRIYQVTVAKPEDMRGTWTVRPALGNGVVPLGLIPPPEIRKAEGCFVGGACLTPSAPTTLTPGQALDLSWDAKGYTPGLSLDLYATDANGERAYITSTRTLSLTMAGTTRWAPALASGSYTLTALLSSDEGATVKQNLGTLVYADNTAPAAPRNLAAAPQRDLSVLLNWDGMAAEADVLGYQVAVDGGEPIQKDGKLASLRSYGLAAGSTHSFAVAAYDKSGNIGEAAVVTATMPLLGLSGNWPADGAVLTSTAEVGGSFSGIVSSSALTVTNAAGQVIPGTTTPITSEILLQGVTTGATPLAQDADTGIATIETGASFVPAGGTLAPGRYTATILAWDASAQEQVTVTWSFEVMQTEKRFFMPLFFRS